MMLYKVDEWHSALKSASLLTRFYKIPIGFHEGFHVDFPIIDRVQTPPNKDSVNIYSEEFNKTLRKELDKERYIGPFLPHNLISLIGPFQSSPISIIPKPGRPGKFRLVQNFLFPIKPTPVFCFPLH
jgi:hypothetical protein